MTEQEKRQRIEQEKQKLDRSYLFKYLDAFCEGYYNPRKLLTFNRPISCVTGLRSCGKSTSIAAIFILDYLTRGHCFCYTRRDNDAILLTAEKFFADAVNIINEKDEIPFIINKFEHKAGKYFIDVKGRAKAQCGISIPLYKAGKIKSGSQDSPIYNVVYDEFIADDPTEYLGSKDTPEREYDKLMSLYKTLDRKKGQPIRNEVRVFLLGNLATEYNPIFLKFNISDYYSEEARFIRPKNKMWVLEQVDNVDALENFEFSFAYLMSDEKHRRVDFGKGGESSVHEYVKPIPHNAQYTTTLKLKGKLYGVYRDPNDYRYFIGKYKDTGVRPLALDNESFREDDLILVSRWKDYPVMQVLFDSYKRNQLFFQNGRAKKAFLIYFKLMPNI